MQTFRPRLLTFTLRSIALVQLVLGAAFLVAPHDTTVVLGLGAAPAWAEWLFGMMAARFLGYAFGLWHAARDPAPARPWIVSMIFIQAVDWFVTLKYLVLGAVTMGQVTTASFLPVLFVIALFVSMPRAKKAVV